MKRLLLAAIVVFAGAMAYGQTAISTDGVVESTTGGFKFPDGSIQAAAAVAGSAPVEDTGQQSCWDATGGSRSCAGTGEDGDVQAGVAWPTPRFMDNGDGAVTDSLTGLIWLEDAECFGEKTWQAALDQVASFNSGSTACTNYAAGTHTDWRLPNNKEILSLFDYGQAYPALPFGHPFLDVDQHYWSSTTFLDVPEEAWISNHYKGMVHQAAKTPSGFSVFVWPVRGGQ